MPVELQTLPASDDIILHDVPLPLRATFYPLGFPLELATNSEAILAAARQSWGLSCAEFSEPPVSLDLAVTGDESEQLPPQPRFRSHRHLMSIVSDAQHQVICDFSHGCAAGWVTRSVAENPGFVRLHFL